MSGLRVNLRKSTLLGISTHEDLIQNLTVMFRCEMRAWPIKYLGLPLGRNLQKIDFWEPVVNKIAKRLASWKKHSSLEVVD